MESKNLDFDIIELDDSIIDDNNNLQNKIDSVNTEEEEYEDDDTSLINTDLVDDTNIDDLDLTDEDKDLIKKKKEQSKNNSSPVVENDDDDDESDPIKVFATELAEKNLLILPDDYSGSEEELFTAYEKTLDQRAVQMVKDEFQIDNPKVEGFLNFLKNGGKVDDYISIHSKTDWVEVDIDDEDNATALVKTYLSSVKKLESEEAEELVEGYKNKGKLFSQAEKIQGELREFRNKQETEIVASQAEYSRIQKEEYIKSINKIRDVIKKGVSNNVVIAKNEKSNFEDYIFTPLDIKNDKGEVVGRATGFKKVLNEYLSDPEKMVALAYKLYEGLSDKSDKIAIESKVKSKLAETIKKKAGSRPNNINLEFIN